MNDLILRATAPNTEFSAFFLQGMVNRVGTSLHRYGKAADNFPEKVDALASAQRRIDEYQRTGNSEFLIDAANFIMFEFMFPSTLHAHFEATDSDASPGVVSR